MQRIVFRVLCVIFGHLTHCGIDALGWFQECVACGLVGRPRLARRALR